MRQLIGFLGLVAILLGGSPAWADDPVAFVSEIHRSGKGEAAIKPANADWKPVQPLMPVHAGDQVRAAGGHSVVLLYRGGAGAQKVSASNSPFTVAAAPSARGEQARLVTKAVTDFMSLRQPPPTYRQAATRAGGDALTIVSPRQTRLLRGAPTFEWDGPAGLTYAIRVLGPDGVVWSATALPRKPVTYPASAPALKDGVQYTWELEPAGVPAQRASFEILSEADAARVRDTLAAVAATGKGYPRATLTLMRVAVYIDERLYQEARRELDAAAAADREEPTLQQALGHVYEKTGVSTRAVAAFDRAAKLSGEK
ncbi:MAG: hypothetical protein HY216_15625 [Candidatus Rokubacteria bacterium]|nr:hypothetical protein [Candidatus Rokubacteria bacterium]